jgi:hypothetical protein
MIVLLMVVVVERAIGCGSASGRQTRKSIQAAHQKGYERGAHPALTTW